MSPGSGTDDLHSGTRAAPSSASSPPTSPIHGVLFDATGTLLDTRESVGTVYSRRAAPHGVQLPAWRLDDAFDRIVAGAPPRVFPDCDQDEVADCERQWWRAVVRSTFLAADSTIQFANFDRFFCELFAFYQTEQAWSLRPGAKTALLDLRRRGYPTGLVSNFDQRLPSILQALEIDEFFEVIMIPARCRAEKPAARIFSAALERLGLPAQSVVYVGDDPEKDRAAAERMGMQSIDPNILDSLAELDSQIQRLNAERANSLASKAR